MRSANSTIQRFNKPAITIANRQRVKKINQRLLKQIAGGLFAELKITEAELGVNLVGAKEMAEINWKFLKHEGSTDVITFDYNAGQVSSLSQIQEENSGDRQDARPALRGEIFVCVDEAILQTKKFQTSWQSEIVRYIVHGVLHLLGHDDLKPDLRRKMKRKENLLVGRLAQKFSLAQIARRSKMSA